MKIVFQVTYECELPIDELNRFKEKCLEYVEEHYEECAIKSWDDISSETIQSFITDNLSAMIDKSNSGGYKEPAVTLCHNIIGFNYDDENVKDLVKKCVEFILSDIDYEPKFKQLLELSDNLVTGYFGQERTKFNQCGFNLYSQAATLAVRFRVPTKEWKVRVYNEDTGIEECKSGTGWNELIEYLCVESDLTWFINMSKEQIELCKLYKKR